MARRHVELMEQRLAAQETKLGTATARVEKLGQITAAAEANAAKAEARVVEIEKRDEDLRKELTRAHASADQERLDLNQRLNAAEATMCSLRDELRRKLTQESDVREELARLRGHADAMAAKRETLAAKPNGKVNAAAKRTTTNRSKSPNGA